MENKETENYLNIFSLRTESSINDSIEISLTSEEPSIWIFGYGSLCWYPGFEYQNCVTGYIRGYVRRFWQGNTIHRGTVEKPGRVATLVEEQEGITWGCAYQIIGNKALEYLKERECHLGGYKEELTKFYPRLYSSNTNMFPVILYIAMENNSNWLGEASLHNIAEQIVDCSGQNGHNIEYVLKLAEYIRNEIPEAIDDHLFNLENLILENLLKKEICLSTIMKPHSYQSQHVAQENYNEKKLIFTARVPEKKLRCLQI